MIGNASMAYRSTVISLIVCDAAFKGICAKKRRKAEKKTEASGINQNISITVELPHNFCGCVFWPPPFFQDLLWIALVLSLITGSLMESKKKPHERRVEHPTSNLLTLIHKSYTPEKETKTNLNVKLCGATAIGIFICMVSSKCHVSRPILGIWVICNMFVCHWDFSRPEFLQFTNIYFSLVLTVLLMFLWNGSNRKYCWRLKFMKFNLAVLLCHEYDESARKAQLHFRWRDLPSYFTERYSYWSERSSEIRYFRDWLNKFYIGNEHHVMIWKRMKS